MIDLRPDTLDTMTDELGELVAWASKDYIRGGLERAQRLGAEVAERRVRTEELWRLRERIEVFRLKMVPVSHPLAQGSYDALGLVIRDIDARIRELEEGGDE